MTTVARTYLIFCVCCCLFFFEVGHPNIATYPEDWKTSARTVALQKQDYWENFTRDRICRSIDRIANGEPSLFPSLFPSDRSITYQFSFFFLFAEDWISDSFPHVNRSTTKRLSLFTRAEQKEVNRARSMKQLPDLSLIVAGKLGARRGTSGSKVGPSGPETTDAVPVTAEQAPTGGSLRGRIQRRRRETRRLGRSLMRWSEPTWAVPPRRMGRRGRPGIRLQKTLPRRKR